MSLPVINWIKNDPTKHKFFEEGSEFLVALKVGPETGPFRWDFDVIRVECDGDGATFLYRGGDVYSDWDWEDFEYFAVLEGKEPFAELEEA